ncbi:MAG: hypothetical protein WCG81_06925, partial [Candidatus Angelobacter sp.]
TCPYAFVQTESDQSVAAKDHAEPRDQIGQESEVVLLFRWTSVAPDIGHLRLLCGFNQVDFEGRERISK